VLDGIDRLSVAPDEQADVVSLETPGQNAIRLDHRDLGGEPEILGISSSSSRSASGAPGPHTPRPLPSLHVVHRRRPERFFFFRGGRGGVAAGDLAGAELACGSACAGRSGRDPGERGA